MDRKALFDEVCSARDAAWAKIGAVDPYVLTHMVNPTFMGGPRWPALRQAFRVVRRSAGGVIVASDGLSDVADDDGPVEGYGMEVWAETRDALGDHLPSTWLFQMVWQVAQLAAGRRGLGDLLDELGVVSTEVYDVDAPANFLGEEGRAGVLLGLVDEKIAPSKVVLPNGAARLVNAKLLHRSELAYIVAHGEAGRAEVARRILAEPAPLESSVHRTSVV